MTPSFAVECPADRPAWTSLLAADRNSLADQTPQWVDAICADGGYRDASRAYRFADGREFVLPMVERTWPGAAGRWFASPPPAWGFGGLVGVDVDSGVVAAVLRDLASAGALRICVRPDPLRAGAWAQPGNATLTRVPRYAHVVDLGGGHEGLERGFTKSARRGVRQATRAGVTIRTVRTGELLGEHYALYVASVARWAEHQREPLMLARWRARRRDPLSKLQAMAEHLGADFCQHVAYHEGSAVASTIVLLGPSAHDTRGAMDRDRAAPVRANDLLQAHALHHAVDHGCRYYHLGESAGSGSLAHFKEKFGATGHAYEEIRMERLPFTAADTAVRRVVKRVIGFRDA